MSTVSAMASSLYLQYETLTGASSGSSASGSSATSSLLSEFSNSSTTSGLSLTDLLTQAESAQASNAASASFGTSQQTALTKFYSETSSVNSAAQAITGSSGYGLSFDGENGSVTESTVESLVSAYNTLLGDTASNSAYVSSSALSTMKMGVEDSSAALSQIGVTLGSDGKLTVDEDTLASVLENDPDAVKEAMTGVNGLATNLQQSSQELMGQSLSSYAATQSAGSSAAAFYNYAAYLNTTSLWSTLSGSLLNTTA